MNLQEKIAATGNCFKSPPAPKKKRKPLRRVSQKRQGEAKIYRAMIPGWLKRHSTCEIGPIFHRAGIMVKCLGRTTHPHHVKGRIGKLLYDERYMLASCSGECHPQAVHFTHPKEARELGLLQ